MDWIRTLRAAANAVVPATCAGVPGTAAFRITTSGQAPDV